MDTGATFDLNNFNQNVGGIAGSGTISLGSANLSVGNRGTNTTFSGNIVDGGLVGSLTKVGGATLMLGGTNTYTGVTSVQQGALQVGVTNTAGDETDAGSLISPVSVENGSAFFVTENSTVAVATGNTIVTMTDNNRLGNSGTLTGGNNFTGVSAINNNNVLTDNTITVGNDSTGIRVVSNNLVANFEGGTITAGTGSTGISGVSGNIIQNSGVLTVGDNGFGIDVLSRNTVINTEELNFGANSIGISAGSENAVTNSGIMLGGAAGSVGFEVRGTGNTMVNAAGGTMSATIGILVTVTSGSNIAGNLGTLTGTGGTAYDSTNSVAAQSMTNAGTINGDVFFGVANDTMAISTGSTTNGIINGGAGTNTLRLVGTGTDTFDLNDQDVQNFYGAGQRWRQRLDPHGRAGVHGRNDGQQRRAPGERQPDQQCLGAVARPAGRHWEHHRERAQFRHGPSRHREDAGHI